MRKSRLLIVFILLCCALCSCTLMEKRISEQELITAFNNNYEQLNQCAEILYSNADPWKTTIREERKYNWELDLKEDYTQIFGKENWLIVKVTIDKFKPASVAYHVHTIRDFDLPRVEFSFISSDSKPSEKYWKMYVLYYIPTAHPIEGDKYEYIKELFAEGGVNNLIRLDDDWYYSIHEENW